MGQAAAYLAPGSFVQCALPTGSTGSLVGQVVQCYPADASGFFCELQSCGSDDMGAAAWLQSQLTGTTAGGVVHLCFGPSCAVSGGHRAVLHVQYFKPRDMTSLVEPWIVPNAAINAARLMARPHAPALPWQTPPCSPPVPGGSSVEKEEKSLKKKVKELKEKLASSRRPSSGLFDAALSKRKRRKGSDSEDSNTPFDVAPSLTGGSKVSRVASSTPGLLLEDALTEVRRFLVARGGADKAAVDRLMPLFTTYFRSVWQGAHPPSEVGARTNNEMELICSVLDDLISGDLESLGDVLVQRLRALQVSVTQGWEVAEQLELSGRRDVSLVGTNMMSDAVQSRLRMAKLEESTSRAKAKGASKAS